MRHNVLVKKRLRHLRDEYDLTDTQLRAVAPYLVKLEHHQLLDVELKPISNRQYDVWYSPTEDNDT